MRTKVAALALAIAGLCPAGQAEVAKNNVYLGMGLGLSNMKPETNNTGYSIDDGRDVGFKIFVGHDFGEKISAEAFFTNLGHVKLNPGGDIGYEDIAVSGLYYFYQQDKKEYQKGLRAFGRAGIGQMINSSKLNVITENDFQLTYGAGLEYGLGGGYAVRFEADLFDKDAQMVTLGLLKRFGRKAEPVNPDRDGDGVLNEQDQCPGTPPGVQVDAVGCRINPDLDGDGVLNEQDQCPDTPQGEVVNTVGCNPDLDGDGVLNEQDKCSNTPRGAKVDEVGCFLIEEAIILDGVTFETDSSVLIGRSREVLNGVVETLLRHPELKVEVAGYTDSEGTAEYNQWLSERRASAVREYLVEHGVSGDNLTAKGFGGESPVADNANAEGQAKNRRVELHPLD